MNLSYGSRGDDVKKLQEGLNKQGYSLSVDGIFGAQTQQAVRDYQSKNSLAVDGIAGTNTLGKLYGTGATQQPTAQEPLKPSTYVEQPAYKPSENVENYKAQLQQAMQSKPGAYTNQYESQLAELQKQITGRDPFTYDAEGDALYREFKDQYQQLGRQSMMDTMGQAAALTGGYGSTYAQGVGQQAYDAQLRKLTEILPELQQNAYERYRQEGADLQNQYAMLRDLEAQDYGRHQDEKSAWESDVNRLYSLYSGERDYEYGAEMDRLDRENAAMQENRQYAYDTAMGMLGAGIMPSDQMLTDAGISKKDAQSLYSAYQLQMQSYSGGGGGSSGGRSSSGGGGNGTTGGGGEKTPYDILRDDITDLAEQKKSYAELDMYLAKNYVNDDITTDQLQKLRQHAMDEWKKNGRK